MATRLIIRAKGGWDVIMRNDIGGTEKVPAGDYAVIIVRKWWDYETGWRHIGMVTNQDDADRIAAAGRTVYGPKDKAWDPTLVYFDDDAIVSAEQG
jgi:hypothetical protein